MNYLQNYYTDNYDDFGEWFDLIKQNGEVYPRFRIPHEQWVEEYIKTINNRSENEVKELLRYLLFPFTRGMDKIHHATLDNFKRNMDIKNEGMKVYFEKLNNIEMYKRIKNSQEAWEGLSWILQYLPFHPYKAIKSLTLYLESEIAYLPDDRITGIKQSIAIIEAKFIYTNAGLENPILKLKPREFEWLIEVLYRYIGYETTLTPATRDGGKDIIAEIHREDGKETVCVECKLYKTTKLTTQAVRAFAHTIYKENANRGVMFCTGYVNENLKELDSRIQIWSLDEIIILLNAHVGSNWESRLDRLIQNQKIKYQK